MPTRPNKRKAQIVRDFLQAVPDRRHGEHPDDQTIYDVAAEWGQPVSKLRQYRDGKETLPASVVNAFAKLLGYGTSMRGTDVPDPDNYMWSWYGDQLQQQQMLTRNQEYKLFETIDEIRPEASSALWAWADLCVTGAVGENSRHQGGFEPEPHPSTGQDMRNVLDRINRNINVNLLPESAKLMLIRDLCKYGQQFEEVGLGQVNGRIDITAMRNRHVRTMYHHRGEHGEYQPERAYAQIVNPGTEPTYFGATEMVCFALRQSRSDMDGTSIFHPCRRAFIQIEAMEAAMIVRRLERATQRLAWTVDVTGCEGTKAQKKYLGELRNDNKKTRVVDGSRNYHMQRITPPAGEDVWVPVRGKDDPSKVEILKGDESIGEIADVREIFLAKWFAGLGPSKAFLGWEDGTMRSVASELSIFFARKARRCQLMFIEGMHHLVWLSLLLRGIDPRSVKYTIFPPVMGTRDELIRAQIQMMHATTVKYLYDSFGTTGQVPELDWTLKYVMGLDDEVIQALGLTDVMQTTAVGAPKNGTNKNPPRENWDLAAAALGNPEIAQMTDNLQLRLSERALGLRLPSAVAQMERAVAMPFDGGNGLEDACRALGIRELHKA